jgi:hypothetical protein
MVLTSYPESALGGSDRTFGLSMPFLDRAVVMRDAATNRFYNFLSRFVKFIDDRTISALGFLR